MFLFCSWTKRKQERQMRGRIDRAPPLPSRRKSAPLSLLGNTFLQVNPVVIGPGAEG
jgi:hypothetical protein